MARRKIVVAMMMHETNTFSPVPTPLASFRPLVGAPLSRSPRHQHAARRVLASGRKPARDRGAGRGRRAPVGYVEKAAYEGMAEAIVGAVRGGCDAAFLALHGAVVAEHTDDGGGASCSAACARWRRGCRSRSGLDSTPT